MKEKILRQLRSTSGSVSGQDLCNALGVSRTMVWKVINQLKAAGYNIEAVSNKGYRLVSSPDLITVEEVKSRINTDVIGNNIKYYEELDSTNTRAKVLAEEGISHGTLIIAEKQNAGKGRRGRAWSSPKGSDIFMTLVLRPKIMPVRASMLTLVAALAVSKAIEISLNQECHIKWPNDLVMNGKKICGILTEMSAEPDYINYIVVGIGINVNTQKFPEEIEHMATSIFKESGEKVTRAQLISSIMEQFELYYQIFLQTEDLKKLQEEYNNKLINSGKEVKILSGNKNFIGHALGVNEVGELLVEDQDKVIRAIAAGEVSVRGLYEYT